MVFGHGAADIARIETEPESLAVILALVRGLRPRYVIETGTYHGSTARAIALEMPTGCKLDTIENDPRALDYAHAVLDGLVEIQEMSSLDFIPDRPVDFAFLDSGVETRLLELKHFRPFLAKDGIMAMHDSRDVWPELAGWRWVQVPTPRGLLLIQPDA